MSALSVDIDGFAEFVREQTGIALSASKRAYTKQALLKRFNELGLKSTQDYLRYIRKNPGERATWLGMVTTSETYFFRELQHFDFIKQHFPKKPGDGGLRIWSAACSVGAEAYTVSMLLSSLHISHEVIGSDINPQLVSQAQKGLYPLRWLEKIPQSMVKRYCLRGTEEYNGFFLVDHRLIGKVHFMEKNLLHHHPDLGAFDVVFLRNVLLYFDKETKVQVLRNTLKNLKPGGYLFTSRTEFIGNLGLAGLRQVESSIHQRIV